MKIRFLEGVQDDLQKLPNSRLQEVALGWMKRLQSSPDLGRDCGWRQSTGNLSDCKKLYFGEEDDPGVVSLDSDRGKPGHYRIVYRVVDDAIVIVAVGPGHPPPGVDAVYVTAGARLGRIEVSVTRDPSPRRRTRRPPRGRDES